MQGLVILLDLQLMYLLMEAGIKFNYINLGAGYFEC